jgi:non-ribosomal peptide synthase protein (TIGR01720 family)
LVFFVLFDPGVGREKRLLTVAHHLIVDPVSWSLLIGDLDDLYRRHREGQALTLPPPTACFGVYASRLEQRATDFSADADFWLQTPDSRDAAIPVDHPVEDRSNVAGSARTLSVAIDPVTSGILLRDVPSRAAVRGHEVLLAALLQAWADWSGSSRMLFDLEGHGRDTLADELDIASSVGWFTAVFPVVLNRDEADSDRLLQSVRRQLRAVQSRGAGHGVLRWLGRTPEIAAALAEKHRPELLFNFLGRIDTLVGADSFLRVSDEPHGPDRHPEGRRAYLIEINSYVEHDTLRFNIEYHPAVHDAASIELLADRLTRELHAFAEEPDARDSPDLGLSGLDAAGLETVARLLSRNDK